MKKLCIVLLMLTAATATFAQIKNNVSRGTIRFEIKNLGIKTGGVIEKMVADIQFDPAKLATSKITAVADVTTINTDNNMRDKHLKNEDYFDVAKYPSITMSSVSFKKKSGNEYAGQFNITIKDKTKLIDVPFTYTKAGNVDQFKGTFKINRRDFGVGGNSMTLGDEVTIFVEADAAQ
ncbi:YceI family protein [Mucilaginibacter sp.]|uniref:YceI family protein n=1 Tax=Mucilaginibacter sp. TaxID=1882438 RepID=UPI0035BBBCF7